MLTRMNDRDILNFHMAGNKKALPGQKSFKYDEY